MPQPRRILSLWFPRLGAERLLRGRRGLAPGPFAVVADRGNLQILTSLSFEAEQAGLTPGQPLRDARAMCPELISQRANPVAEAAFLTTLRRWAGKFSPWVGEAGGTALPVPGTKAEVAGMDGLVLDITGCAHLFGGEAAMLDEVARDCTTLGLSMRGGIADTVGAAWALARFAGAEVDIGPGGDAIDQEARATRSRAARRPKGPAPARTSRGRRHWTRGGALPAPIPGQGADGDNASDPSRIAPPGALHAALSPLPLAALRLPADTVAGLNRLGLRRIGDVLGTPRAGLARRFGRDLVRRLDQALGVEPEPVSPARPPLRFAVRLGLPEPIGLEEDVMAGVDRLLPELCARLRTKGRGARVVRLELSRVDHGLQVIEVALARPAADPDRIRPLLAMKLGDVDAGFGFDQLRLVAPVHEAVRPEQHRGPLTRRGGATCTATGTGIEDLMGRIGARLGLEAVTRLHPGDSHAPEKAEQVLAAVWSRPARDWHAPPRLRPLLMWRPEPVTAPEHPRLPPRIHWRGRSLEVARATGPERITPEWWLEEEAWRSGQRDYWVVTTRCGLRLWLYYAHGAALSPGWFCQGSFG
ncbi:DNA polymerase Y family protein [Aliiroseovarius sp.]|uniref:Y-family DNA polymerase n=1 Tax=Aliiroseovarius sp. TaxID=1872442 RepID=UPI00262667FD|nr:DNA polymerase Y family protein [Aliiroseovarius sp.]